MADAFISYSRMDKAFAGALKDRLEADGFEIHFDVDDILASEDWARRLADMIASANHFVFIISPHSCQSRECSTEINTAVALSKNIIPVALETTPRDVIPPAIAACQWIPVTDGDMSSCAEQLGTLFKTSPAWLRTHTELTNRARDWDRARRRSALLRGADLGRARTWLDARADHEPPPSTLQIDFITQSRRWQRTSRAIAITLLLVAIAAAVFGQIIVSEGRRLSADNKLVSIAADWMPRDPTKAALVLREVTNPAATPYARANLAQILSLPVASCEMAGHAGGVKDIIVSPDGARILTLAGDGIARLWPVSECATKPIRQITGKGGIEQASFAAGGKAILTLVPTGASLWSLDGVQIGAALEVELKAAWLASSGEVVAVRRDFSVEIWGAAAGLERKATFTPFSHLPGYGAIERVEFSSASNRILLQTVGGTSAVWTVGDPTDAMVLPDGDLLALSPDGAQYARSVLVDQLGREYRRYYNVLVRPVGTATEDQKDLREAEHDSPIGATAFSPDGRYLVTASRQSSLLQLSDLRESNVRRVVRLQQHTSFISAIRMAASGDQFVTVSDDRTACVWRFDSPGSPTVLRGHIGPVTSAAFSPDGRLVVTGSEDGVVRVWRLDAGREPLLLKARGRIVKDAWFTPDDAYVVAYSADPSDNLEAWQPGSNAPPLLIADASLDLKTVARHPLEAAIAAASEDGDIVIKRIAPDAKPVTVGQHPGVKILAFDESGKRLASASAEGQVKIWNLDASGPSVSLELPPDPEVESLKAQLEKNPKDQKLIDRAIEIGVLSMARGVFESLAMSTKSGRVFASDANSVFSWPIDGSRPGIRINPGDKVIEAAAFDPTGALVATAHAWDYTVRLWHADGSGLVRELGAATESIEALRFSPDGKHLIVASKDETVRIWPTAGTDPPIVLRGHTSWVVDAAFSRDSTRVVTASYDGTSRLWNVDGSDQEVVFHHGSYAARFDAADSRIVTAGGDGTVAVWSLDPRRAQADISTRTQICLDETFRTRFLAEDTETAARKAAECRVRR